MDRTSTVIVPDLVGQAVDIANEEATDVGLVLSGGDPDGPSLRARTWPGLFWVTAQDPLPGTVVSRGSSVQISFREDGETRSDVAAQTGGPLPSLEMHADAEDHGPANSLDD